LDVEIDRVDGGEVVETFGEPAGRNEGLSHEPDQDTRSAESAALRFRARSTEPTERD
jgi:hypothetical protein